MFWKCRVLKHQDAFSNCLKLRPVCNGVLHMYATWQLVLHWGPVSVYWDLFLCSVFSWRATLQVSLPSPDRCATRDRLGRSTVTRWRLEGRRLIGARDFHALLVSKNGTHPMFYPLMWCGQVSKPHVAHALDSNILYFVEMDASGIGQQHRRSQMLSAPLCGWGLRHDERTRSLGEYTKFLIVWNKLRGLIGT